MGAYLRTFALFVLLTGIFVVFGYVIGSVWLGNAIGGVLTFLLLAGAMNAIAYFASDRIVLWSYRAKLVTEAEAPGLYRIVRQVTQQANLPMPTVAIIPTQVGMILAPIAAILVQLAISRSREYKADYSGAKTIGQPLALASALEKLEVANRRRPLTFGSPASQSLFIVNPFAAGAFVRMFSTHPPIQERIARLRALAQGVDKY